MFMKYIVLFFYEIDTSLNSNKSLELANITNAMSTDPTGNLKIPSISDLHPNKINIDKNKELLKSKFKSWLLYNPISEQLKKTAIGWIKDAVNGSDNALIQLVGNKIISTVESKLIKERTPPIKPVKKDVQNLTNIVKNDSSEKKPVKIMKLTENPVKKKSKKFKIDIKKIPFSKILKEAKFFVEVMFPEAKELFRKAEAGEPTAVFLAKKFQAMFTLAAKVVEIGAGPGAIDFAVKLAQGYLPRLLDHFLKANKKDLKKWKADDDAKDAIEVDEDLIEDATEEDEADENDEEDKKEEIEKEDLSENKENDNSEENINKENSEENNELTSGKDFNNNIKINTNSDHKNKQLENLNLEINDSSIGLQKNSSSKSLDIPAGKGVSITFNINV